MSVSTETVDNKPRPWRTLAHGVELAPDAWTDDARAVLQPGAVALVAHLHRQLESDRRALLEARVARQHAWDAGEVPTAPAGAATRAARAPAWRVAELPADLRRRRVEITGPVSNRRMVVRMLSRNDDGHRADTAMLDFEDSMKPEWPQVVAGVRNLAGAARGELTAVKPGAGGAPDRILTLDPDDMALPMVRVRGLHLDEPRLRVDGRPVCAGLFDFALCAFSSVEALLARGVTPTYYVPKCEHWREARWWNHLVRAVQRELALKIGTLRLTFLIETLPAALQIEEILYEIREHAAGLNVGRWDKIFSDIKVLMRHPDRVLADRATIGMDRPWMRDYARRLIEVCHRRGALAIGGMAAATPGGTPQLRAEQTAAVLADKRREAALGHDGCWVSHPYFIGPALSAFPRSDQRDRRHPTLGERPDLLPRGGGPRTMAGLRTNLRVTIAYLRGWDAGLGCIAWDDLMEDLATLEISRAQTWQWLHHHTVLDDGTRVTRTVIERVLDRELERILHQLEHDAETLAAERRAFRRARQRAGDLFAGASFAPFLETAIDSREE